MKIQLIKPLFLLLGLLFVVSCQEDNLNDNLDNNKQSIKPSYSKEYIKFKDLMNQNNLVRDRINSFKAKDLVSSSIYDFSFVNDEVMYIDGDSFDQYTFPVVRDTINPNYIENYVLKENDNGEYKQYLIKYKKTQENYSYESIQMINDPNIVQPKCFPVLVDVISVGYNCVQVDDNEGQNVGCGADEEDCNSTHEECESYDTLFIYESTCDGSSSGGGGSSSGSGNGDSGSPNIGGGNSGNNDSNTIDDDDVIGDPVEPELILKEPVREYFENLEDDKKDCYDNSGLTVDGSGGSLTNSMIDDIEEFLNENTTGGFFDANGVIDPDAAAFADAILEDCDSDAIESAYEIDEPEVPILDMEDYLDCFDTNSNATVTIYVQEPSAGSGTVVNFPNGVGHAFIGISQGSNQANFGFYPEDSAKLGDNSGDTGRFGNDSDTEFTVSISVNVDGDTLESIIDSSQYTNPTLFPPGVPDDFTGWNYDTYDNNCSDFVLSVANDIGLNFNDTYSDYPLDSGGGNNPGALGQAIREGDFNNSNIETPEIETDPNSNNNTPPNNNC